MTNKIQFNATDYFNNPEGYTLETRGGVKVPKEALSKSDNLEPGETHPFEYDHPESGRWYITENGNVFSSESLDEKDLFMIPITQDIPFTLEDFKSGKYDITDKKYKAKPLAAFWSEKLLVLSIIWEEYGSIDYKPSMFDQLLLIEKPITPYTHPEMYEVSDDYVSVSFSEVVQAFKNRNK